MEAYTFINALNKNNELDPTVPPQEIKKLYNLFKDMESSLDGEKIVTVAFWQNIINVLGTSYLKSTGKVSDRIGLRLRSTLFIIAGHLKADIIPGVREGLSDVAECLNSGIKFRRHQNDYRFKSYPLLDESVKIFNFVAKEHIKASQQKIQDEVNNKRQEELPLGSSGRIEVLYAKFISSVWNAAVAGEKEEMNLTSGPKGENDDDINEINNYVDFDENKFGDEFAKKNSYQRLVDPSRRNSKNYMDTDEN